MFGCLGGWLMSRGRVAMGRLEAVTFDCTQFVSRRTLKGPEDNSILLSQWQYFDSASRIATGIMLGIIQGGKKEIIIMPPF